MAAAALCATGLAACAWYVGWGVHGCNDWGGNPVCEQMDRDFRIYTAGLAAVACGLVLAGVAGLKAVRRRSTR